MANTNLKDYNGTQLNPTTTADLVSITDLESKDSNVKTEIEVLRDNAFGYVLLDLDDNKMTFSSVSDKVLGDIDLSDYAATISKEDVEKALAGEEVTEEPEGWLGWDGLNALISGIASSYISADETQNLTEEQKETARGNLGISASGMTMKVQTDMYRDNDIAAEESYTVPSYEMNENALQVFIDGVMVVQGEEWDEDTSTSIKFHDTVLKNSSIVIYARG